MKFKSRPLVIALSFAIPFLTRIPPVFAEAQVIHGVEIDDLPLLGPYLLPTHAPAQSIRIAFRGTAPETVNASGEISYGINSLEENSVAFTGSARHVLELEDLKPKAPSISKFPPSGISTLLPRTILWSRKMEASRAAASTRD